LFSEEVTLQLLPEEPANESPCDSTSCRGFSFGGGDGRAAQLCVGAAVLSVAAGASSRSATRARFDSPSVKSLPTIVSMSMNTPITLLIMLFLLFITQVTSVPLPDGARMNSHVF